MKKRIIGVIQPFDKKQRFYVSDGGNVISDTYVVFDDIVPTIFDLMETYDTYVVNFVGPKQYIRGLIKKIEKQEIDKYGLNKLEMHGG